MRLDFTIFNQWSSVVWMNLVYLRERPILVVLRSVVPLFILLATQLLNGVEVEMNPYNQELRMEPQKLYPGSKATVFQTEGTDQKGKAILDLFVGAYVNKTRDSWGMQVQRHIEKVENVDPLVSPRSNEYLLGSHFSHNSKTNRMNVTVLHDPLALHAEPLAILAAINAMPLSPRFSKLLTKSQRPASGVTTLSPALPNIPLRVTIKPLPATQREQDSQFAYLSRIDCLWNSIALLLCFTCITSAAVIVPIALHARGLSYLMKNNYGMCDMVNVLSSPLCHLPIYFLFGLLTVLFTLFIPKLRFVISMMNWKPGAVIALYGLNTLPTVDMLFNCFQDPWHAFIYVWSAQSIAGVIPMILITTPGVHDDFIGVETLYILLFLVSPQFCLVYVFYLMCSWNHVAQYCSPEVYDLCFQSGNTASACCKDTLRLPFTSKKPLTFCEPSCPVIRKDFSLYEGPGLALLLLLLLVQLALRCLVGILTNLCRQISRHFRKQGRLSVKGPARKWKNEDSDVKLERKLVHEHFREPITMPHAVLFHNVLKKNPTLSTKNVREITTVIPTGSCFCFLGQAESGKSALVNMIVGLEEPSAGQILIRGYSPENAHKKVRVSFLPQKGGILNVLTARQMLHWVGVLCVRKQSFRVKLEEKVNQMLQSLFMTDMADVLCGEMILDDRRKLGVGIALLGDPEIIVLDEPTDGIDYTDKVIIWTLIESAHRAGKTVVMTTKDPEECNRLASHMAIMVNGHLTCMGTPRHLLKRYGRGYTVTARFLTNSDGYSMSQNPFIKFLIDTYSYADVMANPMNTQFHFPERDLNLSKLFSVFEDGRELFNVSDYSLEPTSLKHIFNKMSSTSDSEIIQTLNDGSLEEIRPVTPASSSTLEQKPSLSDINMSIVTESDKKSTLSRARKTMMDNTQIESIHSFGSRVD